ncbi:hypothetical protein ACFOVU_27270 [Nocardiopsis sediminis]|uniref:Uncharacterized protein n=1 Tax=Nocardiopsis sediminis TaxID=1778267 RepID=A0ABV8FY04_9ACTN
MMHTDPSRESHADVPEIVTDVEELRLLIAERRDSPSVPMSDVLAETLARGEFSTR